MLIDLGDEKIQDFIHIWENMELDISLAPIPQGVPPPPPPQKGHDDVYREIPTTKISDQELGRIAGWEQSTCEEPVLYLQLESCFGRQDVREDEGRTMRRNSESSSAYSPTSISSGDSEIMVLTPYMVSSPNPSGSGADPTVFFGEEGNLGSLNASTSTLSDYALSPVNLSPVPDGLYPPPPLYPQVRNTPVPAPVAQESLLHPVLTRTPPPRPPRSPTPLQLATVPEIAHPTSHSSTGTSSYPSPRDSHFENPRARPVTPARKAVSTPSSPDRLRANSPLPIKPPGTGASQSPIPSPPRSWGPNSTPDGPVLTRKAAKMLGIDFPPISTLQQDLKSHSSNLSTASSSLSVLSSGHSSAASSHSSRSSASTPPSPLPYDPTLDCATLNNALNQYATPRGTPHLLNKTVAKISLQPSNLPPLHRIFRALPSNQGTTLNTKIRTQTTGEHRILLLRLLSGPYRSDAEWLSTYCRHHPRHPRTQIPQDDKLVAEIIFGKSPRELRLLKSAFAELNNGWDLRDALVELCPEGTASAALGRAASRMMKCDRDEEEVLGTKRDEDIAGHVEDLYAVAEGSGSGVKYLDQRLLLEVVIRRSDAFLRDLCGRFRERHARELVDVVAARERVLVGKGGVWPNNLAYAVIHALGCASSKPARDAKLMHDTIGLLGVQDTRLIARAVRLHFNQRHLRAVKTAYKAKYGKGLAEQIGGEVKKGAYRDLIVRVLEGARV
ncbi:Annexin [Choiromyces venosus 120613-1]|uniref:Annexin n=1 Tax=Choiromyces venosus 120613-1 TaxID=1336337 RepID=A0A3N4K4A7_9PEZI|nr:Annexin [Choiromyces venosus 120613-1]